MVERQEVEALLALVEAEKGRWSPHVPAPTLAALCRAWLAVEDAPVTELEWGDFNRGLLIDDPRMGGYAWEQRLTGQRVRIVREVGE